MAPTRATKSGLSRSLPVSACDCTDTCILVFVFFLLNADSLCITLYVICLYMKTHMYFVRVSTCVFVQSLDGLNKEFCSVLVVHHGFHPARLKLVISLKATGVHRFLIDSLVKTPEVSIK